MNVLRVFFGVLLLLTVVKAQAQLRIDITKGGDNPTPVAVVPFAWLGSGLLSEDTSKIVTDDLLRSGQFKPMARADMLSQPASKAEVYLKDWRMKGVDYLLYGRISPVGSGGYSVSYGLMDIRRGKQVAAWKISKVRDLRAAAHHISDDVYEKLTGLKGTFSTKLMYVMVNQRGSGEKIYRLQVSDADGERQVNLLQSSDPIMSPAWSPSGMQIAYVSFAGGRPGIYIQNRRTGKRNRLTDFAGINGAPDWSPDGKKMAMVLSKDGNPEIYIMNLKTRALRRLTNHYAIDTEPRWAKDGRSLVFTSNRGGSPQIYRINVADGQVTRLTFQGRYNARGQLSPDGNDLVMVHRENGRFKISVQNLGQDVFTNLTETELDESPSFSPNGSMVVYATQHGNRGVLGAVSVNASVTYLLPALDGEVREPVWSPYLH
ncbi:MAG: Tol-Pal system beta propeller repeat protein TolB [Gammaproteobacteria bacterium]|nr:Tol-Pal system beta propeller repeat protein TolB [Gammaproteobacteria bacterium]